MSKSPISSDSVLDAINGGIVVLDLSRRVVLWNGWMRAASGVTEDDARGKSLAEIFPQARLRRLSLAISVALTSNASTIFTHALNPSLLPLETRGRRPLLHDITVSPVGRTGTEGCLIAITDITAATRRVRYLREQQDARYDAVVASAPDAIITVDDEGIVRFANPAALLFFSRSGSELTGSDAALLFETQREWTSLWRGAMDANGSDQPNELIAALPGGEVRHFEGSASRWKSGARLFVTVILRDITERRAITAALR